MPKLCLDLAMHSDQPRPADFKALFAAFGKASIVAAACLLMAATGCRTSAHDSGSVHVPIASAAQPASAEASRSPEIRGGTNSLVLQAGDMVQISFPGASTLDSTQVIRQDGKVSLVGMGEFQAAGLTPSEMERQLLKLYGPQLVTQEVSVTVKSSAFILYLTGAIAKPGQLNSDRRISPLEAVIQAGVDLTKANLKGVQIIRTHPDGRVERYKLNLRNTLKGRFTEPFALEPLDIIYVPEKFTWF